MSANSDLDLVPAIATRREDALSGLGKMVSQGLGLGPQVLALPVPVRHRLLRHGVHGGGRGPRYDLARFGAEFPRFSPRQADLLMVVGHDQRRSRRPSSSASTSRCAEPEVGDRVRRLRLDGRLLRQLRDRAGHRPDHPGRRLHPGLPAAPRAGARRADPAAGEDRGSAAPAASNTRRRRSRRRGRPCPRPHSRKLKERFPDAVTETYTGKGGDDVALVRSEAIAEVCRFLRDDPELRFDMAPYITAVDYLGSEPRFEVVYQLYSTRKNHRIRLRGRASRSPTRWWRASPHLEGRQLVGARVLGHVRHPLRGAPRSAPHPTVRGVRRPPAAQGLPAARTAAALPERTVDELFRGPGPTGG